MTFSFRPAKREGVWLLIGVAGGTGSGKTMSALMIAEGIAEETGGKLCVIDTEAGRAKHYAKEFKFDHGDLSAPFSPERYVDAICAAEAAGYSVIVIDSASHEWAGEGGVIDMHDAELDAVVERKREFAASKGWQFDEYKTREANNIAAWIGPKGAHKRMMTKLLQVRAHVILCFRAEDKIEIVKNQQGKMEVVPKSTASGFKGWVPVCEKNMPFELTCSLLMTNDAPGYPIHIKVQDQHKALFPTDKTVTRESGRAIARWARGEDIAPASTSAPKRAPKQDTPEALAASVKALAGLGVDATAHLGREPAVTDLPALRTLYAERKAAPPAAEEGRAF